MKPFLSHLNFNLAKGALLQKTHLIFEPDWSVMAIKNIQTIKNINWMWIHTFQNFKHH